MGSDNGILQSFSIETGFEGETQGFKDISAGCKWQNEVFLGGIGERLKCLNGGEIIRTTYSKVLEM